MVILVQVVSIISMQTEYKSRRWRYSLQEVLKNDVALRTSLQNHHQHLEVIQNYMIPLSDVAFVIKIQQYNFYCRGHSYENLVEKYNISGEEDQDKFTL
jgi:hypothetical protein